MWQSFSKENKLSFSGIFQYTSHCSLSWFFNINQTKPQKILQNVPDTVFHLWGAFYLRLSIISMCLAIIWLGKQVICELPQKSKPTTIALSVKPNLGQISYCPKSLCKKMSSKHTFMYGGNPQQSIKLNIPTTRVRIQISFNNWSTTAALW